MTNEDTINSAFARAEAAFERALQQSMRAQEVEFQKLAEAVLADMAALAVEKILGGIAAGQPGNACSASAISEAIARAASSGGRFL